MAQVPFVGPSYNLDSRPASIQRTVNLVPVPLEPGNERTQWVFEDVPGLVALTDPTGEAGPDDVILLTHFTAAAEEYDSSHFHGTATEVGTITISGGTFNVSTITGDASYLLYSGSQFGHVSGAPWTLECFVTFTSRANANHVAFLKYSFASEEYALGLYLSSGRVSLETPAFVSPDALTASGLSVGVQTHVALVCPSGLNPTLRCYIAGTEAFTYANAVAINAGAVSGYCLLGTFGGSAAQIYTLDDCRLRSSEVYTADFTPPTPPFPNPP